MKKLLILTLFTSLILSGCNSQPKSESELLTDTPKDTQESVQVEKQNTTKNLETKTTPKPTPTPTKQAEAYNYTNSEFDLSFDLPNGWSITEEAEVDLDMMSQLEITLRPNDNENVAISINTPPKEIGYPGATYEDGFNRNIDGLTLINSLLFRNNENGRLFTKDSYYKNESDWSSHIEFSFSAPQGTFDGYLQDYYKLLDSIVY